MLLFLHVQYSQVGIFFMLKFPSQSSFINKKLEFSSKRFPFAIIVNTNWLITHGKSISIDNAYLHLHYDY